jgi:hypothetical protein
MISRSLESITSRIRRTRRRRNQHTIYIENKFNMLSFNGPQIEIYNRLENDNYVRDEGVADQHSQTMLLVFHRNIEHAEFCLD